jgi:uncharacterized cupredoxin-like copper-binding protein
VKRVLALLTGAALALVACGAGSGGPLRIEIVLHYSHYEPARISIPAGRAVTFVLRNADPIDHEWIVGDEALHQRHRTGTEARHDARPTEVTIDALSTRETTVTFASSATLTFVCHLPGHETYGMVGVLTVTP